MYEKIFAINCRPPGESTCLKINFLNSQSKTYVVGAQKIRLIEMVLLSTHNTCLN